MVQDLSQNGKAQNSTVLLFDQAKREEFTIYSGFRLLHKHVRNAWHVDVNNDELTDATFDNCRILSYPLLVLNFMWKSLMPCANLLNLAVVYCLQSRFRDPNSLLQVFRSKRSSHFNGIINRSIGAAAGVTVEQSDTGGFARNGRLEATSATLDDNNNNNNNQTALTFVYPYGATLNVNRNSVAVLSTGTVCYPISRPICAFHNVEGGGRVVVIGSTHMFSDDYFEKEQNSKIFDVIIKFLSEGIDLNPIDAADPELADAHPIPDHIQLSNQLKMCLQESEVEQTIFGDFTKLFDSSLCSIGLENWAETMRCYERLGLKHEPLTLVTPVFEVPQPPLQPAVFPPNFREIPPPQLELLTWMMLFPPTNRLNQLIDPVFTFLSGAESELDIFVREAGELLGISRMLALNEKNSKKILEHVLHQIVEYKKEGQDLDIPPPYIKDEDDSHQNNNMNIFAPTGNEDDHYFSDIDEYDDIQ
uniref:Uncharacterized protein n=1 Tax=Ditylenchus dipsaci TaxID=166011 RepID=A0A915DDG6_9BILA